MSRKLGELLANTEWFHGWGDLSDMYDCRQDNDIFQLSRNINVGYFATVVLKDYVAAILNTPR